MATTSVDTKKSAGWRSLRFETIGECISEVQRIAEADREGRLSTKGNWSAGQILSHIAAWIEYGYDGYPMGKPPFFIRWILKLRVKKMLEQGMPRGVRIPGVQGGTFGMDQEGAAKAAERLIAALRRLESGELCPYESPAFGPMSHEDRIRLNLRHAELHLGYLAY